MAALRDGTEHLRVLKVTESEDRLALLAPIVMVLGHDVTAREIGVGEVRAVIARERTGLALVGFGDSSQPVGAR